MMDEKGPITRRAFWENFFLDAVDLIVEVKKNLREGQRVGEVLSSFDDYPIVGTYPADLFENEAERMGIDIQKVGEEEAIRQIVVGSLFHTKKQKP